MPRRNPTHLNAGATGLLPLAIETKVMSHFLCNARCFSHRISSLISSTETGHLPGCPFPGNHVMWHPHWRSIQLIALVDTVSLHAAWLCQAMLAFWMKGRQGSKGWEISPYRDQYSLLGFRDLGNKGAPRRPGAPSITCCVSSYLPYLCTSLAHQPHKAPRHICRGNN